MVLVSCLWVQALTCGLGFGLAVMFVELKRVFAATYIETALVETIYFAVLVLGGQSVFTVSARQKHGSVGWLSYGLTAHSTRQQSYVSVSREIWRTSTK